MMTPPVSGPKPQALNAQCLINETLKQLRQGQPVNSANPLYPALQFFASRIKALSPEQQQQFSQALMLRICETPELSTRFLLRLMSDLSDAVCEGREWPYFTLSPLP